VLVDWVSGVERRVTRFVYGSGRVCIWDCVRWFVKLRWDWKVKSV